jgi:putative transposase
MCRILYNSCLLDRRNHYEQTGKGLSRINQQVIVKNDKDKFEFLNDIHSQVLQDVLIRVDKAFQNFFRRVKSKESKAGYPRFKGEGRYASITYPQEPAFQITEQGLKLSKIGTVKIKLHRSIVGTLKTCTIKKEIGRWYACFSVEYEPVKKPIPNKEIGIDVGINSFATLSNGSKIDNPKYFRKSEQKLIQKQRHLSKKKKGSGNRKKAKTVLAKLHCKVRNQRSDFHHKISRKVVDTYGFIAVEDLNIKGMVRNHSLAKSNSMLVGGNLSIICNTKRQKLVFR